MRVFRLLAAAAALFLAMSAAPASAQFFLKPVDLSGPRVTGNEPGMVGQAFPDASPQELRAALVWNLRAALNVAALQCQFEPTLNTLDHYNAMLHDHTAELDRSYKTLRAYFDRTAGSKKAGQAALDQFSTRVYSGFSTVGGQLSFCQTANDVGGAALFSPHESLGELAENRMYELRRSLLSWGDQQFRRPISVTIPALPYFANAECWDDSEYRVRRCGPFPRS